MYKRYCVMSSSDSKKIDFVCASSSRKNDFRLRRNKDFKKDYKRSLRKENNGATLDLISYSANVLYNSNPKFYNKQRVRLKNSTVAIRLYTQRNNYIKFLLCYLLFLPFVWSEISSQQWCPSNCSCETFSLPTVASVQNTWPSLLRSSLLSDALLVPLRNPTTYDALVASILTANLSPDDVYHSEEGDKDTSGGNDTHKHPILSSSIPQTSSLISPGEISVDCRDKDFRGPIVNPKDQNLDAKVIDKIVKIDLSSNGLTSIPKNYFEVLSSLRYLILDFNSLESIGHEVLPLSLLQLSLEDNLFRRPPQAIKSLKWLKILNLAKNQIVKLQRDSMPALPNLILLSLHGNKIYSIEEGSFSKLSKLQILDLTDNHLSEIPKVLQECKGLRQILLGDNKITYVAEGSFSHLENLQWVDLQGNPLLDVHPKAFMGLSSLVKLILESVRHLNSIPSFNGTRNLEALRIDRAVLLSVPGDLCGTLPKLKSLNLHLNEIQNLPNLSMCKALRLLDLSNNKISSLGHKHFRGAPFLHDLLLQYNFIEYIPQDAFNNLVNLQVLNLEFNRISVIHPEAFLPLISLEDINLGNNHFPELPSVGLERVVSLKAHNNRYLRIFPGPSSFPAVHSLILSYAYHCCPFLSSYNDDMETSTEFQEDVVFSVDQLHKFDPDIWNHSNVWPHIEGIPTSEFLNVWAKDDAEEGATSEGTSPVTPSMGVLLSKRKDANYSGLHPGNGSDAGTRRILRNIYCIPQPGPFMPCRDLFDWWTLRCGVWLVFLLALMGNGVVVIVLVSAYAKMDVPRFLVANLALADFFMGIYLGILAVVDASTLGDFRMYAIPWQMSAGCQLAGFLGVLSSELSVYTLTVITMERNYAITHAMHLNKRLSLKHAAYIMAAGWVFALSMAILPLAGISDYRKFAVCLPFETDGAGLGYIVFLMFINGIAFLILMGCYLKIYCAIRGSQAWNSNDSRIAKRMALLVFTDFVCWAPIAFFSLSAAFGLQLISLEGAKVFTVFVLPLNSCCNPFLYALLTKQFKKDCVMLCKAIEESRVTRGIGRCRHSSNFSNRQTPANTNSALDQNSKEDNQTCSCRSKDQQNTRGNVAIRTLRILCCRSDRSTLNPKKLAASEKSPLKEIKTNTFESSKLTAPWLWKGQAASNLRLLELRRQATMDLARKSSQESSLSSSRNDSSGTSGSTVTWRISRSSVSSDASSSGNKAVVRSGSIKEKSKDEVEPTIKIETALGTRANVHSYGKPRLQRQRAVDKEPGTYGQHFGNELRCPLHARGDNLSCVYEQASLEEEDSNEVFLVSDPPYPSHRRSLSDGLLCGTLLSLSAPTPQLVPSIAPSLQRAKSSSKDQIVHVYTESSEVKTESYDDVVSTESTSKQQGILETHFPLDKSTEGDPLLHKRN